jgi:Holliday junction DNA helicase RuvA
VIYSLRGKLVHYDTQGIAVECGGVAYYCQTTISTLSQIAEPGAEVHVYTHMHFQQDAVGLFAFADERELGCFRMLIGVSGVGPKAALSILSAMTPDRFALAVAAEDYKSITAAQGIGPKLAKRILLELKDKVAGASLGSAFADSPVANLNINAGNAGEAISALVVLGYGQSEAAAVIAKMDASTPVEEMIKAGLKALAGGR